MMMPNVDVVKKAMSIWGGVCIIVQTVGNVQDAVSTVMLALPDGWTPAWMVAAVGWFVGLFQVG